eukprot:129408-Chlamydomonas_euryale.AAC.3
MRDLAASPRSCFPVSLSPSLTVSAVTQLNGMRHAVVSLRPPQQAERNLAAAAPRARCAPSATASASGRVTRRCARTRRCRSS